MSKQLHANIQYAHTVVKTPVLIEQDEGTTLHSCRATYTDAEGDQFIVEVAFAEALTIGHQRRRVRQELLAAFPHIEVVR
jgi:hypothetical protein